MLIGEQPGLQEDAQGLPFVGPAGGLLDRALEDAHVDLSTLYLTNTVKHFKYVLPGKLRLHKRANAAQQEACRIWLGAELARLQPHIVVALGAMAAQTLFGSTFSITRERGQWRRLAAGTDRNLAPLVPRSKPLQLVSPRRVARESRCSRRRGDRPRSVG